MARTTRQDPALEQLIEERGGDFTYVESLPLDKVDEVESLRNQVRLEPIQAEAVDRYANFYRMGAEFPPLVVLDRGAGRKPYVILDGNQRFQGMYKHELNLGKIKSHPAYIVSGTEETLRALKVAFNTKHGMPPTRQDSVHHAAWLVESGATMATAAKLTGLAPHDVRTFMAEYESNRRAQELGGISGFADLPRSVKAHLNGLKMDSVFEAASRLVIGTGIGSHSVKALVADVNKSRAEKKQLQVVADYAKAHKPLKRDNAGGILKQQRNPRWRVMQVLGSLDNVRFDEAIPFVRDEERNDLAKRAMEAAEKLVTFADELESA